MNPHFRRHHELISFVLATATPLALIVVDVAQGVQIQKQEQELENLRADVATIRLNLLTPSSNAPYSSRNSVTATSK